MRFYGEEYQEFNGQIQKKDGHLITLFIPDLACEFQIPDFLINGFINLESNSIQKMKLPLWFMKKKRLIPFSDNFLLKN